jgi:hypothetical protein
MEHQKTVLKLKSGQMLNPIFPMRGLYTHSTFTPNPDPNEKPLEQIHYQNTTQELGDETQIQILGPKMKFEENPFLAHSLQVVNYRVFQSELIESKPARKGYLGSSKDYTHLNTLKVRLIGFAAADGKSMSIVLSSLLDEFSDSSPGKRAVLFEM